MTRRGWQRQTFALLHLLYTHRNILNGDAQLLSAYEQAYGPWNIKLTKNIFARRRWHLGTLDSDRDDADGKGSSNREEDGDLQVIFPESQSKNLDQSNDEKESSSYERIHITTKSVTVRSVSCILDLEKSGHFTLFIGQEDYSHNAKKELNDIHHDAYSTDTASLRKNNSTSSSIHQPLKGEWYLAPNPYCITDRHFDTLLLVSEPRIRKLRRSAIIEKATVELRCKIWGRYGVGAVRKKLGLKHGRAQGRMTHGTVTIVKERTRETLLGTRCCRQGKLWVHFLAGQM